MPTGYAYRINPYSKANISAAKRIQTAFRKKVAPKAMTTTKPTRKTTTNLKLTKPMKTLVDRRINKHLEVKELRYMLFDPTDGPGTTAYTLRNAISDLSIKPLLCPITQSDDPTANSAFREGNQINPVSMTLRVKLYIKSDEDPEGLGAADRGAIQPFLFVGHMKNVRNNINLTANNYDKLLPFVWKASAGPSTQQTPTRQGEAEAFSGYRDQFLLGRYNNSLLRPVKGGVKQPVITREVGYYQNPLATEGGGGFSNRHVERNYLFNIPVPKKLNYTNNEANFPDNFAPFLMCGFTYVAGADPSIQAPLRIETCVHFRYTDA